VSISGACPDTLEQLETILEAGRARVSAEEQLLRGFLEASSLYDFEASTSS
jgi:hypothetical protein